MCPFKYSFSASFPQRHLFCKAIWSNKCFLLVKWMTKQNINNRKSPFVCSVSYVNEMFAVYQLTCRMTIYSTTTTKLVKYHKCNIIKISITKLSKWWVIECAKECTMFSKQPCTMTPKMASAGHTYCHLLLINFAVRTISGRKDCRPVIWAVIRWQSFLTPCIFSDRLAPIAVP